jgi:predicted nucleic acid-binding Zn ribbon protein
MPFYTFTCTSEACNHTQDYLVKMDTKKTECAKCGNPADYQMSYKFAATGLPNGHNTRRGGIKNH